MILTEEELKEIIGFVEYDLEEGNNIFWGHAKIMLEEINRLKESELSYLSANAELSFKNQKYKQALEHICEVEMDSAEFEKEVMFNIARDILKEELK